MSFANDYFNRFQLAFDCIDRSEFDNGICLVKTAWASGRQIITLGNGGSAMTALHFNADWSKSIYLMNDHKPFRGRSLLDNLGLVTAYSNDLSYEDLFLEQLRNVLEPGDLVVAISGSGNSENVIRAVEYANGHDAITLGLSGFDGGRLRKVAHHSIWVGVNDMQLVEDIHAMFGHVVVQALAYHKTKALQI